MRHRAPVSPNQPHESRRIILLGHQTPHNSEHKLINVFYLLWPLGW